MTTTFAYASDIHLEFGSLNSKLTLTDADILLLAGDICLVSDMFTEYSIQYNLCLNFFKLVSSKYKQVIWCPGNHEYYDSYINSVDKIVAKFFTDNNINNIIFSDCGTYIHDTIKIVFTTLWTDINKANPLNMIDAKNMMNDYTHIRVSPGIKFTPEYSVAVHDKHKEFIYTECSNFSGNIVVMSHHKPVMVRDEYKNPSSYFYSSTDMEQVIYDNENIKYWIFGHTHERELFDVGSTKVLCNCRGYHGIEKQADSFKIKTFTL